MGHHVPLLLVLLLWVSGSTGAIVVPQSPTSLLVSPRERSSISCRTIQSVNEVFGIIQSIIWYPQRA
ncbi:Ig kappa chain V-IV region [Sciurus carolinensis]|uniref:Ig kappa chain V-IV region n=1 Tax=Sciurus carolinensis TaxID=30640 RepID=A0AA41MLE3_SCICA|nr:Ig kappa chain V-IV region [Sciurus carolinensis]